MSLHKLDCKKFGSNMKLGIAQQLRLYKRKNDCEYKVIYKISNYLGTSTD